MIIAATVTISGPWLLIVVLLLVVGTIGATLLIFSALWDRFVEPAYERYFARKNGWDHDWLRQAKARKYDS